MLEFRLVSSSKCVPLPKDYLCIVIDSFSERFKDLLTLIKADAAHAFFVAHGSVSEKEVLLSVSLQIENQLGGTTFHASIEYDGVKEGVTDLLNQACDILSEGFDQVFLPLEKFCVKSYLELSLIDFYDKYNIPLDWVQCTHEKTTIYLRCDRSNLHLEGQAEAWLRANDPLLAQSLDQEQKDVKKLFVGANIGKS